MTNNTDTVLMIRPVQFRLNEQTAVNNFYQDQDVDMLDSTANKRAQEEFNAFAKALQNHGINVIIAEDDNRHDTPDSIFPNNWISTHENGDVALYPMFAENRRKERRPEVLKLIEQEGYRIDNVVDYTEAEDYDTFLEGTGSIVLDRKNRMAYCSLSPRANEDLFIEFCEDFEYTPVIFVAYQDVDGRRMPIYHTNVMMAMAENFAVICLESIDDKSERKHVKKMLKDSGMAVIEITEDQVESFAGNMLQVKNKSGERYLVMSSQAYNALAAEQIAQIEKHSKILHSDITTIEQLGGGGVRCMMAEVFLPKD